MIFFLIDICQDYQLDSIKKQIKQLNLISLLDNINLNNSISIVQFLMQQHYKRLYLMATRHNDFITQKTISNYLSTKENSQIDYDTLFQTKKCLKQMKLTIHKEKDDKQMNKNVRMMEIFSGRRENLMHRRGKSLQSQSGLMTFQNDYKNYVASPKKQKTKLTTLKKVKQLPSASPLHLEQSQLDIYIDQYLEELVKQKNQSFRGQLQADRKGFIEMAIRKIKKKIIEQRKSQEQNNNENENVNKNKNLQKSLQNVQRSKRTEISNVRIKGNGVSEIAKKRETKVILTENGTFQSKQQVKEMKIGEQIFINYEHKSKSKSIPTIPNSLQKHLPTITKSLIPSLQLMKCSVPVNRSIYNSTTPSSQFIQRIGQTFLTKEVNMLNKIKQLQCKNRERANRNFRRKMMSLEKGQDVRVVDFKN